MAKAKAKLIFAKPVSRTRVTGTFANIEGKVVNTDFSCSYGTVTSSYGTVAVNGDVRTTRDFVTPNYRLRSAMGEIINNPFWTELEQQTSSGQYAKVKSIAATCLAPVKYAVADVQGPQAYWRLNHDAGIRLHRQSLLSDSDIRSARSVAASSAWNKSSSHAADILVDIAEMRQTLRMLRDPIQSTSALLRKLKSLKTAKNVSSHDVIDYANGLWLQYRFGIRPLVSSVQGVVKALKAIHEKRRTTHRGGYSLKSSSFVTGSYTLGNPIDFDYSFKYEDEVVIRTGLLLEEQVTLAQELGVDASGLLTLPWELVPFSFVADWFANVNTFLGGLVPYLTKEPLSTWTTTTRRRSTIFNVTATNVKAGWTVERPIQETRSATFTTKERNPGLEAPSVVWRPQAFQKVFNDLRVIDAFALLQKQFTAVFTR